MSDTNGKSAKHGHTAGHEKNKTAAMAMVGIPCTSAHNPFRKRACVMHLQREALKGSKKRWMLDSGASNHYTSNRSLFVSFHKTKPMPIETASQVIYGEGVGDVVLNLTCGTIQVSNIIYVPLMIQHTSLILIEQLEDKGIEFSIGNNMWKMWKDGSLWAVAYKENNVYYLEQMPDKDNTTTSTSSSVVSFPAMTAPKELRRTATQSIEL